MMPERRHANAAAASTASLHFVAMRPEHVAQVHAVERSVYAVGGWTAAVFADAIGSGHECWTAWCGEQLVGHAVMAAARGRAHLLNISVRPSAQRRGHGRALATHMIDRARRRGAAAITLEVRPSNARAGRLYRALGFIEIGRRKNFYRAPKESARLLELRLDRHRAAAVRNR